MSQINNLVIVSDLHCGGQLGLCPAEGVTLDEGGRYEPSALQLKVWSMWEEFWGEWVPTACHGEPYAVLLNGDAIEGVHHGTTHQISQNLKDQRKIAEEVLRPIVQKAARYYHIRGTVVHVGQSAVQEETLAQSLGAIPNDVGQYARYELWIRVGKGLVHALHHIGMTGSAAYEATAVHKELVEEFNEAGRWREEPPDVVVRSHRHRHIEARVPTSKGYGISFVTACWQLHTPFVYRVAGARLSAPQIGGSLIRQGDEDLFTRHKVWPIKRPKIEVL